MVTAARRAPVVRPAASEVSTSHALPMLNSAPAPAPWTNRMTNSAGSLSCAKTNASDATADSSAAGSATGRRPHRSAAGPASTSAGTMPTAYTPKRAVSSVSDMSSVTW